MAETTTVNLGDLLRKKLEGEDRARATNTLVRKIYELDLGALGRYYFRSLTAMLYRASQEDDDHIVDLKIHEVSLNVPLGACVWRVDWYESDGCGTTELAETLFLDRFFGSISDVDYDTVKVVAEKIYLNH